jgi:hypothetical protein
MSVTDTSLLSEPPFARTGSSWQFVEHDLLVFERASGPWGPFRTLVSRVTFCTQRQCSCRDVTMTAMGLDLGMEFSRAPLALETLRPLLDSPQAMHARLAIDLGLVEADDYEGRSPLSGAWVEWLQSQVDGELLDLLHERWLRAKGWRLRTPEEVQWPAPQAGELLGWHETHPDERRDLFLDENLVFMAEEFYCVNPSCTCSEVIIDFAELLERDRARSIGSLRVALPDLHVLEWESSRKPRAVLERLWTAFQRRHVRLAERLLTRKQRMGELGRTHRAGSAPRPLPNVDAAKVGRNDRCPCGSGQKYKRCCASQPSGSTSRTSRGERRTHP